MWFVKLIWERETFAHQKGAAVTHTKGFVRQRGANKNGTYSSGSRVYAGLYFGKRNGVFEQRWGIDGAFVQDFFQNGIHRHIVKGPYFNTNFGPPTRSFYQLRTNTPWSLY